MVSPYRNKDAVSHGKWFAGRKRVQELEAFQEAIFARLAQVTTAHVLGRSTGDRYREIFAYLREAFAADALLTIVAGDAPPREFQYSIRKDPKWENVAWMGLQLALHSLAGYCTGDSGTD